MESTASKKPQGDTKKLEELEARMKALEVELQKMKELAARAQADLQNAKMRMAKDEEERRRFVSEVVLLRFVPVIDHFQRAFQHLPQELKDHEWVKGMTVIARDLMKELQGMGLRKMEGLVGKKVDSLKHEVLLTGPGEGGIILEVIEDGYEVNGRLLRPAKVKVGQGTATQPSSEGTSESAP
jgi:molecular chaperone GrpE